LAPANVAEDGEMAMWSMWALTERIGTPAHAASGGFEAMTLAFMQHGEKPEVLEALRGPFAVLDRALAKTGWLVGGRFTVADVNVAGIVRYAPGAKDPFPPQPHRKKGC